jgi:hypothetical protein
LFLLFSLMFTGRRQAHAAVRNGAFCRAEGRHRPIAAGLSATLEPMAPVLRKEWRAHEAIHVRL